MPQAWPITGIVDGATGGSRSSSELLGAARRIRIKITRNGRIIQRIKGIFGSTNGVPVGVESMMDEVED